MNKALFLDRDGIINIDHGYVSDKASFEFVDGIFTVCQTAQTLGYKLFVITNQSGIGRGKYSEQDFLELTEWMKAKFLDRAITIDDVFYCPHHPEKALGEYLTQCKCRKPEPGMILEAANKYNIELNNSIFIGDKVSDIQAAQSAGINNRILVSSQYGDNETISAQRVKQVKDAVKIVEAFDK